MRKTRVNRFSSALFRKTGLLFAFLSGLYLLIFLASTLFRNIFQASFTIPLSLLIAVALCTLFFTFSALNDSLSWLQPLILLAITPWPMAYHRVPIFSLGTFIAAEILLYRLGFFERKKLVKFALSIAYFFLCEVLAGITSGEEALDITLSLLFMSIFLVFLLLVYGERWVVYLKEPKPPLSLSTLRVTSKEAEYLKALLGGKSIKEIAIEGGVKESTVRNTLARVYRKFDVQDKSALMAKCENYSITS